MTEIAYEHWHRMLFARFLAESNLLVRPSWVMLLTQRQSCIMVEKNMAQEGLALTLRL